MTHDFYPGATVRVGDNIKGTVEELIFARGMASPMYFVEWWQDGQIVGRRFHEKDVFRWEGKA